MAEPRIQYCTTSDGIRIAYARAGQAGPELVLVPFIGQSHLLHVWELAGALHPLLADRFKVLYYDSRGSGLSERNALDFSLDALLLDLEAVAEHTADSFVLMAHIDAVPVAIRYAVKHPERVSRLIISDGWARIADFPQDGPIDIERTLRDSNWAAFTEVFGRLAAGFDNPSAGSAYAEYLRSAVTQEGWKASQEAMNDWDVREDLPRITVPTLVVHSMDNKFVPPESGQRIAAAIPGAELRIQPRATAADLVEHVAEFSGLGSRAFVGETGSLRTVLFTDLTSSTALTQRLGDAKAQELVRAHNTIVREALAAQGGNEIKHTGDGIMASFPTASGALECALSIQRNVAQRNEPDLAVHIGLNAGEPVAEESDLFGTSVQLARRICDHAASGQILVSNVVRELSAGKGFLFADIGEVVPKGFEEPVRLYEVRWQDDA